LYDGYQFTYFKRPFLNRCHQYDKKYVGGVDSPEYYHPNHGNPRLADLAGIPQISQKLKLNIVDILKPLYHGGPTASLATSGLISHYGGY